VTGLERFLEALAKSPHTFVIRRGYIETGGGTKTDVAVECVCIPIELSPDHYFQVDIPVRLRDSLLLDKDE